MRRFQPSPLASFLAASLATHAFAAWVLSEREAVRTIDFGEERVVSVRLFSPSPPVPEAAPPAPPPPVEPPRPAPAPRPEKPVAEPVVREPEPLPEARPVAVAEPAPPTTPVPPAVSAPAPRDPPAVAPAGVQRDDVAEYVETINALIRDQKRYPKLARKRKIEGRVLVVLEISAEGELSALRLRDEAPRVLGRATEAAIRRAAPFPIPPGGAKRIEIEIEYTLRDVS